MILPSAATICQYPAVFYTLPINNLSTIAGGNAMALSGPEESKIAPRNPARSAILENGGRKTASPTVAAQRADPNRTRE